MASVLVLRAELAGEGDADEMVNFIVAKGSGGLAKAAGTCTTVVMPVRLVGYGSDDLALGPNEPLGSLLSWVPVSGRLTPA